MRVAIIDSGVSKNHNRLKNLNINGFGIEYRNEEITKIEEYEDQNGHGTAVAGIISKHLPNADFICIKIFFERLLIHEKVLSFAFKWCVVNNIDIINLSLGIDKSIPKLYNLCSEAVNRGTIIIAASNNNVNHMAYPAAYPNVFGVAIGKVKKREQFGFLNNSPVEFLAKGALQRVPWLNNSYNVVQGTSYACAHFTGIVAKKILETKEFNVEKLKNMLINDSDEKVNPYVSPIPVGENKIIISNVDTRKKGEDLFNNKSRFGWLKRMAIFPTVEKEMNSFVKFNEEVSSEVKYYIDYPRTIFSAYHTKNEVEILNRLPDSIILKEIDTIVVGYYLDQVFEPNINFGNELIELAIKNNKNIFYFDSRLSTIIDELNEKYDYEGKVYCPKITKKEFEEFQCFHYNLPVNTPVLAVIGTSSVQGKFTAQLVINKILSDEGYKVGFISTEPQGELFGANYSFPYGHNSLIDIDLGQWSETIANITKGIQESVRPDIITTGTQGGLISRDYNNDFSLVSIMYLKSINPDVFVCAVNPEDSMEIIYDTIKMAKMLTGATLLTCILNPFSRIDDDGDIRYKNLSEFEYNNKRENIIQQLNVPVIDIMASSNSEFILTSIEDALSK